MAKRFFDDHEIDVPCPQCGHKTKQSIGWLRANKEMTCVGCGVAISLEDKGFRAGLDKVEKSLADLRNTFSGFGKRR